MPQLLVHGWWNIGGAKMSKSVGNIVDPFVLVDKYGADALRYYLMSDMATGKDADFSEERLIERYNARSGKLVRQSAESHLEHGASISRWTLSFIDVQPEERSIVLRTVEVETRS